MEMWQPFGVDAQETTEFCYIIFVHGLQILTTNIYDGDETDIWHMEG